MVSIPIERDDDRAGAREVRRLIKQSSFLLIFWLFGIGSIIAIANGARARKLIVASEGRIQGIVGAWVCIVLGLVEIGMWINLVATGSFH